MLRIFKKKLFTIIFLAALSLFYVYVVGTDKDKLTELKQREREIKSEISALRVELGRLEDYYELSKTPEFIERMAREKLGMVKKDEIIYYIRHSAERGTDDE